MCARTGEPTASAEKDGRTVGPTRTLAHRTASRKGHMMGEPVFDNLINAVRNVTLSRKRALQVIGGAIAVAMPARIAPSAEAGKHSKPPLAVASVVLVNVEPSGRDVVAWFYKGAVDPAEGGFAALLDTSSTGFSATATTDQARKHLLVSVRAHAAEAL